MDNKAKISILKNYAELAWASYFFFDLAKDSKGNPRTIYKFDKNGEKIADTSFPREYKEREVTLEHIVSKKYQGQEVLPYLEEETSPDKKLTNTFNTLFNSDRLNGEFSPIQAQKFCKRYELIFHQPNTSSGFSATLFYDTQKDKYIVSFRGTETNMPSIIQDIFQDISLTLGYNPQSSALLDFLKEVSKIVRNKNISIVFVGHSLGGYLAQVAYIYCEKKYRETLAFSPSEVYTFNAPSVYGWNLPTPFLSPNIIKIALDFLEKNIIDISEKITHIFDDGGVEIIASAQYGAENRLALYTGEDAHSIIPITQTLYFYEYLLALASNEKIFLKQRLQESFDALNTYHQNLGKYFYSSLEKVEGYINKKMMEKTKARDFRKPPLSKKLQALYLDISQKVEQTPMGMLFGLYLYFLDKKTEKKAMVETLFEEKNIIEIITSLKEESLFVRSIDNDRLKEYQKNIQKAQDDIAIRVALSTFAIFIFINQEDQSILTKEEFLSILGYSTPEIIIALADWDKDYLAFQAKTTRAFYFEGSVQVRA